MLSISQQFSLIDILRKMLLSISQQFSLTEFLKKMLYLQKYTESENQDVGHLISELNKELSTKRYLIILDDVWEVDMWNQLKVALPDVKNGSRVIITSRSIDVAKSADSKMAPYELKFLDDKKSLNLLLKKAFPYQEHGEECPSYLLDLAKELSKKCRGLPLALVVIGGILSTKENSYPVWERVLRTINWHSDGKDCMRVLAMSYEDMPYYVKACFLYLASFPEDYEIPAKRLIRMWVAEGFIPQEERKTMEETAEDCLEQLFQRSMVHVSSRYMNGSIKSCQVHDLLRNLAMHEASQENFVTIFSQDSIVNHPNKRIRRASFHYSFQAQHGNPPSFEPPLKLMLQPQIEEYVGRNTRSLLLFGLHLSNCSYFRLLKVLEVVGVTSYTRDLELDELMHLKYLGFRKCDMHVDFSSCSFHRMKTLETLDVRGTTAQLPNALWTIGTLRHVLCDSGSLDGPISTVNLRNLQTMRWVSPVIEWERKLPLLNNLCKLGVNNSLEKWVTVTNLLQTLPSLVSLRIKGKSLPMEIVYPKALPNYQNLQSLYLEGTWSLENNVTLEASLFPPYLVKLTLTRSRLQQNPMPELGKLKSLKKLCLREYALNYLGPTICPEGFPILQYLEVDDRGIKDLTVAQGVMPKLTYLQVHGNIQLHLPPELQHVTLKKNFSRDP
ncbi:toMV susceptible protein tm-2-like [Carex rostrata]